MRWSWSQFRRTALIFVGVYVFVNLVKLFF
jgi:hypothetical protein